jgi:uncharacterized protein (TIGR03083 family)
VAGVSLPFAVYLDTIAEEAARLEDAVRAHPDAPIPNCPTWTATDLLWHVRDVYENWTSQLVAADPGVRAPHDTPIHDGDATVAFEEAVSGLVATLEEVGADSPSWNWSDDEFTAAWVARRMALESAVHRVDAEQGAGDAHEVERELAVDGIDERLDVHLRLDVAEAPEASLGGSLCLVCRDDAAAWVVDVERGRLRWRHGRGPADAALVGTASDLFLFTWNRVSPDALELTGSRAVVEAWRDLPC